MKDTFSLSFIANNLYLFCCLLLGNFCILIVWLFRCTKQLDRTRTKASEFSSHCLFLTHSDPHVWMLHMLYIALSRSQNFSNICIWIGCPVNMKLFVPVCLCVHLHFCKCIWMDLASDLVCGLLMPNNDKFICVMLCTWDIKAQGIDWDQ